MTSNKVGIRNQSESNNLNYNNYNDEPMVGDIENESISQESVDRNSFISEQSV